MEITGNLYCGMVMSAANFLGKNKEKINNLNVFRYRTETPGLT